MRTDLPPEEFRRVGHEVVEWIAGYLENIREYPVLAKTEPGELTAALPRSGPDAGEPMDRIFADFKELILPAVTHWNHPRFNAYFAITGSGPGILGELLAAALNVNGMLWKSCPAATELEQVTLGWLREWLALDPSWFGMIYDTASTSSLHAIAAAREQAFPQVRAEGGLHGAVMYVSEQAHSSIEKGAITLGIGQNQVRKIGVDVAFRMRPELLERAIAEDQVEGRKPFFVAATVGTTSTSSVDPVAAIADIAERHGLWLHVDGAYAGSACIVPEYRRYLNGVERADSLVVNPHKWLFTPTDISVFYTRKPDILRRAFSLVPEYLKTAEDPRALNAMDYGFQLGRRFRALKFWFVLRYYGRDGLCALIREHISLASRFAAYVSGDARFELAAPNPFSLVCFRLKAGDEATRALHAAVDATHEQFLSHTVLNGRYALRYAIGNARTTEADVDAAWQLIARLADR